MFDQARLDKQLSFYLETDKMKTILRQTLLADASRRETDAEHSWHIALLSILLYEYAADKDSIDLDKAVKMALVHDLIEVYAGDTFAYDDAGNKDKSERELDAANKLYALLPSDQASAFRSLWEEFEAMVTPESRFANAMDRFQPFLNNCATNGHTWKKGRVSVSQVYRRMDIISQTVPALWPYVEQKIAEAVSRGFIAEDV